MQSLSPSKSFGFTPTIHIINTSYPNTNWRQNKPSTFPPQINPKTHLPKSTHTHTHTTISPMAKPKKTKTISPMAKPKKTKETPKKEEEEKKKQYWLLKTEPGEWSWDDQSANGGLSKWDGVKNRQAINNLKSMRLNDLCFFYHSGTKSRRVVGVISVIREWYADGDDENVGAVDLKAVGEMRRGVDLKEMKREIGFKDFGLIRQPRLSVVAVEKGVWDRVCELGCGYEGDGNEVDDD